MTAAGRINWQIRYRTTMIITLCVMGSVLLLMLVAYIMALSIKDSPLRLPQQTTIGRVLYGLAFVMGIGIIIGRRAIFNTSRLWRLAEEGGLRRLINELSSKTIILVALSESIALLGFILSVLMKSSEPMWRLGGVGVLLIFYNMPRRSAWEHTIETFSRSIYEE